MFAVRQKGMKHLPMFYCYFCKKSHPRPTHCRQCGKELPNLRVWYCGGREGACALAYWSLYVWDYARSLAIKRAGNKCERCGSEKDLQVHHKEPVKGLPRIGEVNRRENLEVLCRKCHGKTWARAIKNREARERMKNQLELILLRG